MTPASRYALASFQQLPEHVKDNEFILGHYQRQLAARQGRPQLVPSAQRDAQRLDVRMNDVFLVRLVFFMRGHLCSYFLLEFIFIFFSFLVICGDLLCVLCVMASRHLIGIAGGQFCGGASGGGTSRAILKGTNSLVNLNWISEEEMKIGSLQSAATWWPFFVFLGGSMFCLLSSNCCHLFSCHSHYLNIQLLWTDYVGIMVMIITSFFPPIYCIFNCVPHWQLIYLGRITVMGMFTFMTLLAPSLSSGKFWAFQAMLFSSMGFFGIVSAIHACIVNWSNPQHPITLTYESAMALSYITGTLFYVSRIPERLKPGWFDLADHSHQIFHIFVIMGVLAYYGATLLLLQW